MAANEPSPQSAIPSVDRLLNAPGAGALFDAHGRDAVTEAIRETLGDLRRALTDDGRAARVRTDEADIMAAVAARLSARAAPTLKRVFNLTGTVLHTNLGRAPLPEEAIAAMTDVARGASNLEYDLATGKRGDRDVHIEDLLRRLTGAEAATVVNNNAAAVFLTLNTLALRKQVPVSRGELIEIGGSFRIPDIMARAGCKLAEVGTTNRTHLRDFADAITNKTALLMKVHASNYVVEGFTAAVAEPDLAKLAHDNDLPFVVDLGSGTLVDLSRYGLPHEPTAAETVAAGADIVTFSGDKLLGGPQAGMIVGRADLIARIKKNPIKRAMRLDKVTIACLGAVLRLYADPGRLAERVPVIRLLARGEGEIAELARRLQPALAARFKGAFTVTIAPCQSQIGSGSLPVERLAGWALVIAPAAAKKGTGGALKRLAAALRALPVPVIGRIKDGAVILDLRCLEDEAGFLAQLGDLDFGK